MSLSKEAVLDKMKQSHVVVLNILPEEEFKKLHIQDSHNLPLTGDPGAFIQAVERQYGKEKYFIIYGSNLTNRAAIDATEILQKKGINADVYLSGLREWKEAGFPTEGTLAPQPIGVSP